MATPTLITTRAAAADHQTLVRPVLDALDRIVVGKSRQVQLAVACLLARGHLLIQDVPGVGKTTLAHGLARALPPNTVHERLAAGRRARRVRVPS
jgi:MoxR-like ATPase